MLIVFIVCFYIAFYFASLCPGWANCGHGDDDAVACRSESDGAESESRATAAGAGSSSSEAPADGQQRGSWQPADVLSLQERTALGIKCKQLLDAGRAAWLQQALAGGAGPSDGAGPECAAARTLVKYVQYVPRHLSGENRMLLAAVR